MSETHLTELATPTLMRLARGVYARSIRAQLRAIGVDDLPRNGAFILAGIARSGGPMLQLPSELGVTRQAVSQAVEVLVGRGYLQRNADREDRRRVTLTLTDTGSQIVDAVVAAVDSVDAQLHERVPEEEVRAMRSALIALTEVKAANEAIGSGVRRTARQLRNFSPIFPVRDLPAALAHYATLGFTTFAYEGGEGYGFAIREGIGVHLSADPRHDPAGTAASTYLYVLDADALYEEWSRPGVAGRTHPVGPTPYGLREGAHVDPDGNLIRFGSPFDG